MLVVETHPHKRSRPAQDVDHVQVRSTNNTRAIYSKVSFPSVREEQFRVTFGKDTEESSLTAHADNMLKIHLEGRKTKRQWEASVGSAERTINCIAKEAVIQALTSALRTADGNNATSNTNTHDGAAHCTHIDFINANTEEASISLTVPFFSSAIGFQFKARAIPLQDVDVLRAQLIDAQEEIDALKEAVKSIQAAPPAQFISLKGNNTVSVEGGRAVKWTTVAHNTAPDIFALAANAKSVMVLQPGTYHIQVRRGEAEHEREFSLQLNGARVAQLPITATTNDALQSALLLRETLTLHAHDTLRVVVISNASSSITNPGIANTFSVLKVT